MKPLPISKLFAAFSLLGVALAQVPIEPAKNPFAGDEWKVPTDRPDLKKAPGLELLVGNCVLCHSTDYIVTQPPLTRAQWEAGVMKMRARFGATFPTNVVPPIVDYLSQNYGKQ